MNLSHRVLLVAGLMAGLGTAVNSARAQGVGGPAAGRNVPRTSASSSTGANYPSSTEIGTGTFSVDTDRRRVYFVADEETAKQVKQVVESLNRPPPQVLIKCVFLEATYTKDTDIGVEGIYHYTAKNSSVNQFNGSGDVGTALNVVKQGGLFTYSSAAGDLNVTLSALATAGKTEILSRPSILARNNQPATISLGQQVPLITNTRFDTFGNQINSVTYQDVGIILTVTPFISDNGLVEMVVSPQISQLTDRSQWVPISGGGSNNLSTVSAPVIDSRSADTVVVVPDGQTVVIGGLMQKQKTDSTQKVPVLGDIPLLGALFRHKITSDAKTELMIFMTPHVVKQPSDLAAVTTSEQGKTQLLPKAFTEEDLNRALDNLPTKDDDKKKQ
jgi:general secretion pathway protein D